MAADILETKLENIVVFGVDTDISPYDSGSYASATTYVTGMAVADACKELREKIKEIGAEILGVPVQETELTDKRVYTLDGEREVSKEEIAVKGTCGNNQSLHVTVNRSSKISPPPFMAGMAEVEIDKETGSIEVVDYVQW